MNQISSTNGVKPPRTPDLQFSEVRVRQGGSPVRVPVEDLIERCETVLPGFGPLQVYWAQQLFGKHAERRGNSNAGLDVQRDTLSGYSFNDAADGFAISRQPAMDRSARIDLPASAYVGMCSENLTLQQLNSALAEKGLRLAPAAVLLSTLLVHFSSSSYSVKGFDGKENTVKTYHLSLPGPSRTDERCIIAAGGTLRDGDGIERESLLGARTSPKGLEFFLPYTSERISGGWRPGTLFLVEKMFSR
jgi:hypothetical protein